MTTVRLCKECGAPLPADAPEGLCPQCLMKGGLPSGSASAAATVTEPEATGIHLSPEEQPGALIGRYKLLETLGEGGFGVVYVAEQREPVKRRVALKIIKLGMDTKQVIARFEAERQALALMDHPNIAKVLDAGATENGRPYFVMELVRGIPITAYCDQNILPTQERLGLFTLVCHAIQHAHQKGIIHRDIKPSNILVTLHDGVPVPKVIDFGIAKATQGELTDKTVYTQFQQFIGTPAYMSPEQAEMSGLDIDTRSDIYSLGVLLYQLLTGRTPFDQKELLQVGLDEMRRTIREKEPVRPSTRLTEELLAADPRSLTPKSETDRADSRRVLQIRDRIRDVRGDLDWIVMKCLEKDRTRRYETANGLAMDLQRHLTNEPVLARSPTHFYRFQKLVRRNKLVFAAATAVAVALLAGIGLSTWQAIEASEARRAAQAAQKKAERAEQDEKKERLRAEEREVEKGHLLYVADMNLAQQAWDQSDIGWLRQLLEETQSFPYRGFEWYYWQRQTHLSLQTLRHRGAVRAVAFSKDGRRIATASNDGTAKVWDVASGRELLTLRAHRDGVLCVAFSPDGRWIVTGGGDRTAKVWDAVSGREMASLKYDGMIWALAFSPDSQRVVTGGTAREADQTAKVWEAARGRELLTLKGHSFGGIISIAFSPDGQRIVGGGAPGTDQKAIIWDAASGRELLAIKGHHYGIMAVAFSPDGRRIVTGGGGNVAQVWDATNGRELLTLKGPGWRIEAVAFSPDGERLRIGSRDDEVNRAEVWDGASGRELLTLKGHTGPVEAIAFSPDGELIVTGSADGTAKVWETTGGREPLTFKGHNGATRSAAISSDGQRIVTGGLDGIAKLWETASGREVAHLKHGNPIRTVALSPDGQRILTGSLDGTAKVWDGTSGRDLLTLNANPSQIIHHNPYQITSAAFSPNGQRIVTANDCGSVELWDEASGRELFTLLGAHATGSGGAISCVAVSPDGQRILTGTEVAKVWEAADGRELLTLDVGGAVITSMAFSPDGQRFVAGSSDRTAKVFDTASGRQLLTLKGYQGTIDAVAFSADGRRILTGSADGTAKVWETAGGQQLLSLNGHNGGILAAAFTQDGQRVVVVSSNGTMNVWEAARAAQVAQWHAEDSATQPPSAAQRGERTARTDYLPQSILFRTSIGQWLILAPIPLAPGQSDVQGLEVEQMEGEARLKPIVGETATIGGAKLRWREVVGAYWLDFDAILGPGREQRVAYAICYIRSEAEQRGLRMVLLGEGQKKVYLNGKQKSAVPDDPQVYDITLVAGLNTLVFKIVSGSNDWMFRCQLTDAQGNPAKGKVTLDPEAKDSP